jgi:uncharacterized membrane protein
MGSSVSLIILASSYFLSRALLPRHHGYNSSQQIAVALGLTIVWVGFVELVLSYTPWRIDFWSLVVTLTIASLVNLLLSLVIPGIFREHIRRRARSAEAATTIREKVARKWRHTTLTRDLCSWLFLGFTVAMSFVLTAVFVETSGQKGAFMEFYIDPNMFPETLPWQKTLSPGDLVNIPVTVISHEAQTEHCYVQVLLDNQLYHNVDLAGLKPGQETTAVIPLLMGQSGLHKVGFRLYKNQASVPYRSLHIWLYVSSQ